MLKNGNSSFPSRSRITRHAETAPTAWSRHRHASLTLAAFSERHEVVVVTGISSSNAGVVHHTESPGEARCTGGASAARSQRVEGGVHTEIAPSHALLGLCTGEAGNSEDKKADELEFHGLGMWWNQEAAAQYSRLRLLRFLYQKAHDQNLLFWRLNFHLI